MIPQLGIHHNIEIAPTVDDQTVLRNCHAAIELAKQNLVPQTDARGDQCLTFFRDYAWWADTAFITSRVILPASEMSPRLIMPMT